MNPAPAATTNNASEELKYFLELTGIPRPSGHLARIRKYLAGFASQHGLECKTDESGNVLIIKPGTEEKTIILQSHQDMVPQSLRDFDFENDKLNVIIEDGWIRADGTTLGADDGAGMALMLSALNSLNCSATLECLFTADEETGLCGASGIGNSWLSGKYLINLDNEDVNEITIGSAGSADIVSEFIPEPGGEERVYRMTADGLLGGHSAGMIDSGRANAIVLAAEFLSSLEGVKISSFESGTVPNAIPSKAEVCFSCDGDPFAAMDEFRKSIKNRFSNSDPGIETCLEFSEKRTVWSASFTGKILRTILECPNGTIEKDGYGVKTSSNIGIMRGNQDNAVLVIKPRSSDGKKLAELVGTIKEIMAGAGGRTDCTDIFPEWKEPEDSELIGAAVDVYKRVFGRDPVVTVTHGGLETSVLKEKYKETRMISVGPTITGAHSPDEKMDIGTLSGMRVFLFELIGELAENDHYWKRRLRKT